MFLGDVIGTKIIVLTSKYNVRTFSNMNVEESVQFILFPFNPFFHGMKEGLLFVCFSIQICGDVSKQ